MKAALVKILMFLTLVLSVISAILALFALFFGLFVMFKIVMSLPEVPILPCGTMSETFRYVFLNTRSWLTALIMVGVYLWLLAPIFVDYRSKRYSKFTFWIGLMPLYIALGILLLNIFVGLELFRCELIL